MSALLILVIALALLALGYIFYGSWLAKQWGVDPNRETPAHTSYDGKDFVPANPAVLMGHHFSSIAGAGPINGPIQAAVFGWVPVFLWVVIGGIFFGAMHDFGALFASVRHNGGSIGEVIKDSMGVKAQRLFIVFALAVLILVIASFTAVVAGTFASDYKAATEDAVVVGEDGQETTTKVPITKFADGVKYYTQDADKNYVPVEAGAEFDAEAQYFVKLGLFTKGTIEGQGNASTAMTSILFILIAIVFGFFVYRKNAPVGPATIVGIIAIIGIVICGLLIGLNLGRTFWVLFIAVYVLIASLLPVWILLQPRDYLSSFLLYGMMILAIVAIFGATFAKAGTLAIPAFTGWSDDLTKSFGGASNLGTLFPALFITIACGAVSGFHSLIGSGTTSKQLSSEKDAKVIGYGAMIVESALAIISLIAVGTVWSKLGSDYKMSSPPAIFAGGIATLFGSFAPKATGLIKTLFTLAVSVFALTSLDSATRLCRYLFVELLTPEGKTREDLTGARKFFATPVVSTLIMVIIGCGMGFLGLSQIWGVFGAANQLLAAIAMLAVCTWLGKIGKNNKMFFFPMVFMLIATLTSLVMKIIAVIKGFATSSAALKLAAAGTLPEGKTLADMQAAYTKAWAWGNWFQMIWSIVLVVLAVILVITGVKTLAKEKKA